jgi:signal transduction histidine kinase/CheY-like chemotaxis protein
MSKIFTSLFTLKFLNPDMEKQYALTLNKNLNTKNMIYCFIILSVLIIFDLLYWLEKSDKVIFNTMKINTLIYTAIVLTFIIIIVLFPKKLKVQRTIIYLNFFLLILLEVSLRHYFSNVLHNVHFSIMALIYFFEYSLDLTFFFTKMIDFYEGALLFLAKSVTYYIFYSIFFPLKSHYILALNQILMIIICCISYFYVYEHKMSFYYFKNIETSSSWYRSILEYMNSGFLSITDTRVNYINKSLMFFFDLVKGDLIDSGDRDTGDYDYVLTSSSINRGCERDLIYSVLEGMFGHINLDNCNSAESNLETIKAYLRANSKDTFINLGVCSLIGPKINSIHFEIHGRYYTTSLHEKEDNYDFIFNDISRIKINEEINAEFKYKSVFLSKVAHEFKNPILCITELTEQVKEKIQSLLLNCNDISMEVLQSTNEILTSIKSMSDYLLILVKDMDYFSIKTTTNKKLSIDNDIINVNKLLSFIQDITKILIKKFNKENSISFIIKYNHLPKEIYTDEVKLKQILINLLSNAVKYTLHGQVILELTFLGKEIQIAVIDTGKGLTENKVNNLFQPFAEQTKEYNSISAGLGLSVVKDLITLLDSQIFYEPNIPEGSIFKFIIKMQAGEYIYLNDPEIQRDEICADSGEKTVELDCYPFSSLNFNENVNNSMASGYNETGLNNVSLIRNRSNKTILVVDDEIITRKSTIRLINSYCLLNSINVRILEAADGIECLWLFYQCLTKGEKISLIFSDETMTFMNGTDCANIIYELCKLRGFSILPFYLVTAYESIHLCPKDSIKGVFSKPLKKRSLEKAFNL